MVSPTTERSHALQGVCKLWPAIVCGHLSVQMHVYESFGNRTQFYLIYHGMAPAPQALVDPLLVPGFPLGHYAQRGEVEVGTPSLVQCVV